MLQRRCECLFLRWIHAFPETGLTRFFFFQGTIFELTNVIPFIKKYGVNPATGKKLELKELVRLNFAKNADGKYHDPVSFKDFNEHTHIVAIATSGNVFSYETVQQLNIKAKFLRDLVSDQAFTKTDLITLQVSALSSFKLML